jgi:hypothetical protein
VNDYHQAAALAKAHRGMAAIETLIRDVLIPDPEIPEVTDRLTGLYLISQELIGRNSPAMWLTVGLVDALTNWTDTGSATAPTEFRSSRQFLFPLITEAVAHEHRAKAIHQPDPFDGLTG